MKKLIIILFFILEPLVCLANNPFLEKESNVNSLKKAKNTFIFWINGDTDRFRPSEGIESKNIRIDTLDAKKIRDYSLNCNCNVVLFHDQRFSDKWYTSEKHFGAFIYAYSSGREVNFKFQVKRKKSSGIKGRNKSEVIDVWKNALSFNEIDQNKQFLINLLKFTKVTFPDTKYHLVFRGHSFAESLSDNKIPFDYSNVNIEFNKSVLEAALRESNMQFETISFAACSMSNISFALMLSDYSKFMIATQLNINETGLTGFNFGFLPKVNDKIKSKEMANLIGRNLLKNFNEVEDINLFIRETPITIVNLSELKKLRDEIEIVTRMVKEEFDAKKYEKAKIVINVSKRYLSERKKSGASAKQLNAAKKFIKVKSIDKDYDLGVILNIAGYNHLLEDLMKTIRLINPSPASNKTGLSLDLTYN